MSRTRTNNHHLGSGFNFRKVLLFIVMLLASQAVLVQADCKKGTIMSDSGLPVLEQFPPGEVHYYGEDSLQYGELHLPEGKGPHPVVVMVHGGCWLAAFDMNHMRALANAMEDVGYAVWNIEYRRVGHPGGGWPGTFLDVAAASDHLKTLAQKYPLDMDQVVAVGHSAGGHLALWLAIRHKLTRESEIYTSDPLPLKGVLALEPGTTLKSIHHNRLCGHVIDGLMGGSPAQFPNRYRDAAPMEQIPLGLPHTILVGWLSGFGLPGSTYFYTAQEAGDKQVKYVEAPESGHFEMINPDTSTWPIVLNALENLYK
ncbi:MAG: alpha/beta hydrolase [Pseudomonadota bacterium]|nr:alpha/beta hydrolase [Pseudomonadota bacterium]